MIPPRDVLISTAWVSSVRAHVRQSICRLRRLREQVQADDCSYGHRWPTHSAMTSACSSLAPGREVMVGVDRMPAPISAGQRIENSGRVRREDPGVLIGIDHQGWTGDPR